MNAFILDKSPLYAARYQYDCHVVKMPLETAQMLCTVLNKHGLPAPYKPTHRNHPVTLWAGESLSNFDWLMHHGIYLGEEYTHRYGRRHKSHTVILDLDVPDLPDIGMTPFAQAMPEKYQCDDPVVAYRTYYAQAKRHLRRYSCRPAPEWLAEYLEVTNA